MKIDRSLRLIIELARGDDPPVYIHSEGLPVDVFESYFDLCIPTMNHLVTEGYGYFAPRAAALALRKVAMRAIPPVLKKDSEEYKQAERIIEERLKGFYNELHRLTFVLALKDGRWDMVPIEDGVSLGAITQEEFSRADAALVFFTCSSHSVPLEAVEANLGGLSLFNARTESLNCTEFASFLQTLTKGGNFGVSRDASPQPSPGSHQMRASANGSAESTNQGSPGVRPQPTGIAFTSLPQ